MKDDRKTGRLFLLQITLPTIKTERFLPFKKVLKSVRRYTYISRRNNYGRRSKKRKNPAFSRGFSYNENSFALYKPFRS